MTTHIYHQHPDGREWDIHNDGLFDGCDRCEELADEPLHYLDARMLANLRERHDNGGPARSMAESRAMFRLDHPHA